VVMTDDVKPRGPGRTARHGDLVGTRSHEPRWPARRRERVANAFSASGLLADDSAELAAARLCTRTGELLPFAAERWHRPAEVEEIAVLDHVVGPVLDLACGPGRLVRHLVDRGVVAVGVDTAPEAVAAATRRGVPAVLGDLWGALPDEGAWETVLLFDGNIGIGAEPVALLRRCAELMAPGGGLVVELGPLGTTTRQFEARIEWGGWTSGWFPWATVGVQDLTGLAGAARLEVRWVRQEAGRCFARLGAEGEAVNSSDELAA